MDSTSSPSEILIQAIRPEAEDPLHVEVLAIQLASMIAKQLQFNHVHYFTDNLILTNNIKAQDPVLHAGDWRICHPLADFMDNNSNIQYTCLKISRTINKTAHALAKEAYKSTSSLPCVYNSLNVNHQHYCPVLFALDVVSWGAFLPISVN
jgi:exonuclease III